MRPEVPDGTLVTRLVDVAEVTAEAATLNLERLLAAVSSKLVPLIVTAVPGVPTVGVNPLIVGAPGLPLPIVKGPALDADPDGDVMPTCPVVEPEGTVVRITFGLEAEIAAATPLKVTVF
jgi:hypothetical protein